MNDMTSDIGRTITLFGYEYDSHSRYDTEDVRDMVDNGELDTVDQYNARRWLVSAELRWGY